MIEPQSNYIEHPELVAQRLERWATVVDPSRLMAGVDCGFSIHVGMQGIDPDVAWAKLAAMAAGLRDRLTPAVRLTVLERPPIRLSSRRPAVRISAVRPPRSSGRDGTHSIDAMRGSLMITGDAAADELLNTDGTALLIGMLLDQQVPMEMAFHGPATLRQRLGHLDAGEIAAMSEDEVVAVCCEKPAIHRFPAAMGRRIHALCIVLTTEYGGRGENVWDDVATGDELYRAAAVAAGLRRREVTDLRRRARQADGRTARRLARRAGKFGDDTPRSVADSTSPETLAAVRQWKRAQKAANLDKQDRPL